MFRQDFAAFFARVSAKLGISFINKFKESPTVLNMDASEFLITCCGNPQKTMNLELEASLARRE